MIHEQAVASHPDAPITIRDRSRTAMPADLPEALPMFKEGQIYG